MTTKILLVEDIESVQESTRVQLANERGIEVVGQAKNCREAVDSIRTLNPDMIIMALNMPVSMSVECTVKVKHEFPGKKILILSKHEQEDSVVDLLDAGADGYILRNSSQQELIFAIHKIANDGIYVGPEFTLNILAKYKAAVSNSQHARRPDIKINEREMDVLRLVAEGKTNAQIAKELFTSVRTIETRRKNLLDKTGTTNTATLIRYAVQHGLVN